MRISKCITLILLPLMNVISVMSSDFAIINPKEILWVSPEMKIFLEGGKYENKNRLNRMNTLLRNLVLEEGLNFQYDNSLTLTASEAFRERRGNCLSFAYLYVALGREIGLDVRFNRVDVPPRYSALGKLIVENKHLNVIVRIGSQYYAVDLLPSYRNIMLRKTEILEDEKAFSSYYANLGVNAVADGDHELAGVLFERAYLLDDDYIGNLRNMALLCRVQDNDKKAEEYLLRAVDIGKRDSMVCLMLSELYKDHGDFDKSNHYFDLSYKYLKRNPFYYYANAMESMRNESWEIAVDNLIKSINLYKNCHYLYYDLAYVCERLGRIGDTEKALIRAIKYAPTDDMESFYRKTLSELNQQYADCKESSEGYTVAMR